MRTLHTAALGFVAVLCLQALTVLADDQDCTCDASIKLPKQLIRGADQVAVCEKGYYCQCDVGKRQQCGMTLFVQQYLNEPSQECTIMHIMAFPCESYFESLTTPSPSGSSTTTPSSGSSSTTPSDGLPTTTPSAGLSSTTSRTVSSSITPTTAEPTTTEPTTAVPTTTEPTTPRPTTAEPKTAEPTTAVPTTTEPTTPRPTTAEPTTAEPTTAVPTTAEPTAAERTTSEPPTPDPTTVPSTSTSPQWPPHPVPSTCTASLGDIGDIMLPDPTDCSFYIRCDGGTTWRMPCAPGTLFDYDKQSCDFAWAVDCTASTS